MNTHIEGGLPHHRVRVYIVGIQKSAMQRPSTWPGPIPNVSVSSLLDDHVGDFAEFASLAAYKQKHILAAMSKVPGHRPVGLHN